MKYGLGMSTGGDEGHIKRILIAGLDENNKPVFSTLIEGTMQVDVETDSGDVFTMDGMIMSSWDAVSMYEIIVRGRAVDL